MIMEKRPKQQRRPVFFTYGYNMLRFFVLVVIKTMFRPKKC